MSRAHVARVITAALLSSWCAPAAAEDIVLDLPAALARAAAHAPGAVEVRGRVVEAEAARVSAALRFADNPEIEVEAGPRFGDERTTEVSVQIGQSFGSGGRGARRALAEAGVAQAQAAAGAVDRELAREVALEFYGALYAGRVAEVTRTAEALAARAAEVAVRRRAAGAITDLEVDLTRAALGRARSAVRAAEAERAAAVGLLAARVGAVPGDTVSLRGELRVDGPMTGAAATAELRQRADLQAIEAERAVAGAELRVARAAGRPEAGVWIGYAREENADVVAGGLRFTLPVWNRGQGGRAEARARARRVEEVYEAATRAATREVGDAGEVYARAQEAVEVYEAEVLPLLDDAEALLGRSIEAGTLPVSEFLVARSELLDGRREYLARLLALAQARVAARLAAGVSP